MNDKIKLVAGAAAFAFLTSAGAGAATRHHHDRHVSVEMMRHTTATMKDGTKLDVDVVKMHGRLMVAIPARELPHYLRQQIFDFGQ